ncbi:hypothetical protein DICPUDRAFT_158491 [Dictyostelium purpureum]|uniref:Uncharacterized protein n=1 Tax=Dictyostelium purpureum TaxID=5786 RepID=F1A1R1_DICPU|nr:uncharacterized protein DICPUDRAFT_158491 [Dictyostelium purpureum]EGC29866.1 hypothetical protein DICPUDRAFT_158491 [Dictyostelium purpureum]|eukprot:XP_003293603.1 hypothetical protein DICPUDRAFT_158491 [Dictyostelium purpureum]
MDPILKDSLIKYIKEGDKSNAFATIEEIEKKFENEKNKNNYYLKIVPNAQILKNFFNSFNFYSKESKGNKDSDSYMDNNMNKNNDYNSNNNINNKENIRGSSDSISPKMKKKKKNKSKTIYFYSNMDDQDYYSSISNFFASQFPIIKQETKKSKFLILEKFNDSIDTAYSDGDSDGGSSSVPQTDEKKTILYVKSCGAIRLNCDSFQKDIESLASNQNHTVILVIILIGSNAESILIDYPGYKIFFNTFQNRVCENDFNMESLKTLYTLIN